MSDDTEDDDVAKFDPGSLGDLTYEPPPKRRTTDFQPWHRPRKHYVRRHQWVPTLEDVLAGRDAGEGIRYLGLPGTDLLDLRYIHERVCVPQGRRLRFVGFDTGATTGSAAHVSQQASLQQVKLSPLVHDESDVFPDDFRAMASPQSRAFQEARAAAPFDVVNLDLCGSVGADAAKADQTLYDALRRLLALQARNHRPWIFLITSVFDRTMDASAAKQLWAAFKGAVADCDGFIDECADWIDEDECESQDETSCSAEAFAKSMAVGFCLWIAKLARQPPARANLRASFAYRVLPEAECEDMFSLAIRFTPVIHTDEDTGGLASAADAEPIDLCAQATQFAKRIANTKNLDDLLGADAKLRAQLVKESAELMEQARYEPSEYKLWAKDFTS